MRQIFIMSETHANYKSIICTTSLMSTPASSRIVLKSVTWPGLRYVAFYGFSRLPWPGGAPLTPCDDTVTFTIPADTFGKSARLLGVDLSAAGDAVQRRIGSVSGIRRVYECHVSQTTPISTGEPGVSPVFPLTEDGLEGIVIGGGLYERPVPWGYLYLASRPAAGVRQTLAEGVIYMGTDGQARGFLVFGGGGNYRKVEVVDGQAFSVVDTPFYTRLESAYIEVPEPPPPPPPPRSISARVTPDPVTPGETFTISGSMLEYGQPVGGQRVLIEFEGQRVYLKANTWGAFSWTFKVSENEKRRYLVARLSWGGATRRVVINVIPATPVGVPPGQIAMFEARPSAARPGDTVSLNIAVKNTGQQAAAYTLVNVTDGECVKLRNERQVTLEPEQTVRLTSQYRMYQCGHAQTVELWSAGRLVDAKTVIVDLAEQEVLPAVKRLLLYGTLPSKRVKLNVSVWNTAGDATILAFIDGRPVGETSGPDGTYTVFDGVLQVGDYTARAEVRDRLGRAATASLRFRVQV
jgi:hypothetical protein